MDDESVFGKDMMKYMMYFIIGLSVLGSVIGFVSPGAKATIGGALQGRVVELYGTFSTMAFLYMVMGEEKDSREMFRMGIMLIAASSILSKTYGAGGGIAYEGMGIFFSMFLGKILRKYVSGQGAEDAFKDWYGGKDFGESVIKQLGSAPSKDETQKVYLRVGQGEISLSQPLLDLYDQLAAFKQILDGAPTQAVAAARLATAYRALKAQVNGIEGDKLVKGLVDLTSYNDALKSAKTTLEAADAVNAAAAAAKTPGRAPTQYGKMVAV